MGGIKLSVHPLFFLFGLFYAFTGKILLFVIYTLCAVVHEIGHSFVANSLGYRLNKITLMPFGAVISGNIEGLKFNDQLKIAFAGPLVNLLIAVFFIAGWWIYPISYAYTDIAAEACLSMALVNFIPVFPLDGGRILLAGLSISIGEKKAKRICRITGIVFSIILLVGFVASLINTPNVSLLFFSLFVMFGAFNKDKENIYVRIYSTVSKENLKRGLPVKKQAIHKSVNVKKLISILDYNAINEIIVYDDQKPITTLSQQKIEKIIEGGDLYISIEKQLHI